MPELTVNGTAIYSGAGDPEGVVRASVGALYIRTGDMGFSTEFRLYAKDLGTGTTGWRSVNFTRAIGNASLNSATNGINTVGKRAGSVAFNTSVGKPVWATGTDPTSTWVDATGAVVNTPV